jgi:hypothetical protein
MRNAGDVGENPIWCNNAPHGMKFNRKGHFAKQYLSKTVAMVAYREETSESESTEDK